MEHIKLDPRLITGPISSITPTCVILEITRHFRISIQSHHLTSEKYLSNLNRTIDSLPIPTIPVHQTETGLSPESRNHLGFFVGGPRWNEPQLIQAFHHLRTFMEHDSVLLPEVTFIGGPKTNETPLAYTKLMVYRLCQQEHIPLARDVTPSEMEIALRNYLLPRKTLIDNIIRDLETRSTSQLASLLVNRQLVAAYDQDPEYDPHLIPNVFEGLNNMELLLSRLTPRNHQEAVLAAAFRYGVDISMALKPLDQFRCLENLCRTKDYLPVSDTKLAEAWARAPDWFQVRKTWCKNLDCIYSDDTINRFVASEGFELDFIRMSSPRKLLRSLEERCHLYWGFHPLCDKTQTAIALIPCGEINPSLLTCYGQSNIPGKMIYLTLGEWRNLFRVNWAFTDPLHPTERLNSVVINKLILICNNMMTGNYTHTINSEATNLFAQIEDTQNVVKIINQDILDLSHLLATSVMSYQLTQCVLRSAERISLFCRGWDGKGVYPLSAQQSSTTLSQYAALDVLVYDEVHKYLEALDLLKAKQPIVGELVFKLPIITFSTSSPRIYFGDRVNRQMNCSTTETLHGVIMKLNDVKKEDSCIRTNSNWILTSSVYFMKIFKMPCDINLSQISEIR